MAEPSTVEHSTVEDSTVEDVPVGYIYHLSSKRPIGPNSDSKLVVYGTKAKDQESRLRFRFVQVKEFGHFGYIEHVGSNKIVHPVKNELVLRNEKSANALFAFDLESYIIIHRNGKYWHVKGNDPIPDDGTTLLLQKDKVNKERSTNESVDAQINDTAKFYFGDFEGHREYPYSKKSVKASHHWKLLQAIIAPKTARSLEVTYKVGRVKESSQTVTHAWKISAEVAYSFFKGGFGYDGSFSSAEARSLTEEKSVTLKIDVPKEHTICVWQYVYCLTQYDDEIAFLSNIISDTENTDEKPEIPKLP